MMSNTGQLLTDELDSIRLSITDIMTTPIGTRIMRKDYGSKIPDLIDQPMNDILMIQLYSEIYTPILKWENRISIEQINIHEVGHGKLIMDLDAVHITTDQSINLNIPIKMGGT